MWGDKKKEQRRNKDAVRNQKVAESQQKLLTAAISTADLAADVTRTMRKRMEDAMKQFESTARIMHDGLLICNLNGSVQAWNGAAETMFGITGEVSVASLFEFNGSPLVNADELYEVVKAKKRSLTGKHADQTLFPISVRMSVLERSDGSTVILLAVQDMTAVNKAFDGQYDASAVALSNGEIVAANPGIQRLFGYAPEEILGRNISVIMDSKDRHGAHLDLIFEVARMQWMGDEAVLITMRELADKKPSRGKSDNGIDMVCTYGPDFKITSANATYLRFYGLKKRDALNTDIRQYMPYDEVDEFTKAIRSLTSKNSYYRSHFIETKSDIEVVHDWVDHAIFDARGELVEIQRTGRDVGQAVAKAVAKRPS